MDDGIRHLELVRRRPHRELIEELERLLILARTGKLRGLVAFGVFEDDVDVVTTGDWPVALITWHCLRLANELTQP